jgi:hypothetical protein
MSVPGPCLSANQIRARINRDGVAHQKFERLMSRGVDEGVLLGMLVNLGNYSSSWDAFEVNTGGLDRRQVLAAATKIREAAHLMRKTEWLLLTKDVRYRRTIEGSFPPASIENIDEFRGLPKSVLDFGQRLERALRRPDAPTCWDAALTMLLVYLKQVTGEYQDSAVCDLLMAGLNRKHINEAALSQWRQRHKKQIEAKLKFSPHRR